MISSKSALIFASLTLTISLTFCQEVARSSVSRPSDCSELNGTDCKSGNYKIFPDQTSGFEVYCDMANNGAWWLDGNEHIHQLLSQGNYILSTDLEDFEKKKRYAEYAKFKIVDENSGYKLTIGGYHGNAGDAMTWHNGQKFSTKDKDSDTYGGNCAQKFKGSWWFKDCHLSNLNGMYLKGTHKSYANGIDWEKWHGHYYCLHKSNK